jgi:hypothetical protein
MGRPRAGRRLALPGSARTLMTSALFLFALSACVLETAAEEEKQLRGGEKVSGAVVTADKTSVKADVDTVRLNIAGSKFAGSDVCPDTAYVFYDDDLGIDATIKDLAVENCQVKSGTTDIKLPRAAPGVRTQVVSVLVSGTDEDYNEARSEASVQIKVETPGPVIPAPTSFTAGPAPATHDDGHGGGHHGPVGQPPYADFVLNPSPPVANDVLWLDAGLSTDDDGTIVAYRWDTDGDGAYDDTTGRHTSKLLPNSTDPITVGVEVEDNDGNISRAVFENHPVLPAGSLVAQPPAQSPPSGVEPFDSVQFSPHDMSGDGVTKVEFDGGNDGSFEQSADTAHPDWPTPTFFTSFSTVGPHQVVTAYSGAGGEYSEWRSIVDVESATRRMAYAAAGKKAKKKAKKFKRIKTTATTKLSTRLLSTGKLSLRNGELVAKGLRLRGTINGKVAKAAAKLAPSQLKGLYRSEFVGSFNGSRVMLSPDAFTIRGSGTILARPRKDKKTLVCLSMKSDGTLSPTGSTWRVIGATGKARGFTAKGTFAPVLIGMARPAALDTPNTLDVRASKGKALSKSCKALAKDLPGAKKAKKKKKARK